MGAKIQKYSCQTIKHQLNIHLSRKNHPYPHFTPQESICLGMSVTKCKTQVKEHIGGVSGAFNIKKRCSVTRLGQIGTGQNEWIGTQTFLWYYYLLQIRSSFLGTLPRMLCNRNGAISHLQTEMRLLRTSVTACTIAPFGIFYVRTEI